MPLENGLPTQEESLENWRAFNEMQEMRMLQGSWDEIPKKKKRKIKED